MRLVKILGVGLAAFFMCAGIAVFAWAQQDNGDIPADGAGFMRMHGPMPDMMMGHMKEALGLTDEQLAQVKIVFEETMKKQFEKFKNSNTKPGEVSEAMKAEFETTRKEIEQKLSKILSKEQMTKLQEMQKEFGKFGPGFGPAGKNGEFADRGLFGLIRELNITDTQKEKISGIFKKYREVNVPKEGDEGIMGMHKDLMEMILTEGFNESSVRQLYQDSADKGENAFVAHAKMLSEIKALLTKEQINILKKKLPELQAGFKGMRPFGLPMMGPPMFMGNPE